MKILFIILSIAMLATSCSTNDVVKKEISATSNTAPQARYNQAIAMVESSPDFSDNQKRELSELIGSYAIKTNGIKEKQSQYRQILVDEMLNASNLTTTNKQTARENLSKLNAESNKNLDEFIKDFKEIAGTSAKSSHNVVLQTVDI